MEGLVQYYDWLTVDKNNYLIIFHLGESTREKNELSVKIAILDHKAKRLLSPPSARWEDVNKQLINVITFGHEGQIAQAKALLKEAENTCRLHRQSRIRELYLIGFMIGIIVTIAIGYMIVILLNLLEPSFRINFLVIIFIFSGIGSIVSALTRLKSLDVREGSSDFDIMLSGSVRPIVGMFFSLIAYLILSVKAFKVSIGDSEANPDFVFFLSAFLCGFSERFAHDIVAHMPFTKRSQSGDWDAA
jgi:hypothetical protein